MTESDLKRLVIRFIESVAGSLAAALIISIVSMTLVVPPLHYGVVLQPPHPGVNLQLSWQSPIAGASTTNTLPIGASASTTNAAPR